MVDAVALPLPRGFLPITVCSEITTCQIMNKKDRSGLVCRAAASSNNRINSDWQFRCAPLPAGYAKRYVELRATDVQLRERKK